ncbi:hypothetical protein ZWY2020_049183 [Hordeum vulgare]|nr:hypothetical protein ZWY2020_049183 [Hordeum vulgare]
MLLACRGGGSRGVAVGLARHRCTLVLVGDEGALTATTEEVWRGTTEGEATVVMVGFGHRSLRRGTARRPGELLLLRGSPAGSGKGTIAATKDQEEWRIRQSRGAEWCREDQFEKRSTGSNLELSIREEEGIWRGRCGRQGWTWDFRLETRKVAGEGAVARRDGCRSCGPGEGEGVDGVTEELLWRKVSDDGDVV